MKLPEMSMPIPPGRIDCLFRMMVICLLCILVMGRSASAQAPAGNITLSLKDVAVKTALQELRKKTSYELYYSDSEMGVTRQVTVNLRNATLTEALQAILGKAYVWRIQGKYITITPAPVQDSRQATPTTDASAEVKVSGAVLTATGIPLAGVSIRVKGTQSGTATNADGHFEIPAATGAVLQCSFMGYRTIEVIVNNIHSPLRIMLEENPRALEQVVVTGYVAKRVGELTGAVAQVNAEQLQTTTTQSIFDNLQGKVAGLNISASGSNTSSRTQSNIIIRGKGSMSDGTQPLIVIDGIIQDYASDQDPLSNIASTDIQSVTVLKDAASAAIYGSRAANGVLVITTKRGQAGKTRIGFNATYGLNKAGLGKFRMMNSRERYDLQQQVYKHQYMDANPGATPDAIAAYVKTQVPDSLLNNDTEWPELGLRTGHTQNYDLSLSGGSERFKYYTSGSYYNEVSPMITDSYRKYSFRANTDFQATDRLLLSTNFYLSSINIKGGGFYNALSDAYQLLPWDVPYYADGKLKAGGADEPGWHSGAFFNTLYGRDYNEQTDRYTRIGADMNIKYRLTDWLSLSTRNRYNGDFSDKMMYSDPRDVTGFYYFRKGLLNLNNGRSSNLITTEMLQADKTFGRHRLNGLLGFEYNKLTNNRQIVSVNGLKPGLKMLSAGDQKSLSTRSMITELAYLSFFSELNYSYDGRYYATASFRRDGSSKFGSNNKYGNFYSVSGAWQISAESFMKEAKAVDNLRLRLSYGVSGNDMPLGNYQFLSLYSYLDAYEQYDNQGSITQTVLGNNTLRWEKQQTTNLGIDLGLFNRISLSLELYNKVNNDILLPVQLPSTSGGNDFYDNVGKIRNRGLEVTLSTQQLKGRAFRWSTDVTFAYNDNKVVSLQRGVTQLYRGQYSATITEIGSPMNSYYMPLYAGADPATGSPRWEVHEKDAAGNYTGKISYTDNPGNATLFILGNSNPKFTGGMTNTFSWKDISLSVMLSYFGGLKQLNRTRADLELDGGDVQSNNAALPSGQTRWQQPGDIADAPRAGAKMDAYFPSSRYLEAGDFLRLKNIRLGYNLPDALLKRIGAGKLSFFVSVDNLYTWTKFTGIDPENSFGEENSGKVPFTKRFLAGIQASF